MKLTSFAFKGNVRRQLGNAVLQDNMKRFGGRFVKARAEAMQQVDNLEALRLA